MTPSEHATRGGVKAGAESVLFVTAGRLDLVRHGEDHALEPGGYAYLPPGAAWTDFRIVDIYF